MFNPANPEHLESFERLADADRETLIIRLREQFTDSTAARLFFEGLLAEQLGLVSPPTPPDATDACTVELTRDALSDWRFLVEAVDRAYEGELRSGLSALRSGNLPRAQIAELRRDGFLLRNGKLRWVFRRESDGRVIVHAVARRAHNPLSKVWRYFSQLKAANLIESGQLYLSRLDTLAERAGGDRLEGTPTVPMAEQFTAALIASFGANHRDFLHRYDHTRRSTFVCCWHRAEHEALQMWQGYCVAPPKRGAPPEPGGFALQTTERRLQHQYLKLIDLQSSPGVNYFLREITYIDHAGHIVPDAWGEEVFFKARWFADEKELRLGVRRIDCAAAGTVEQTEERLRSLEKFMRLPVDLGAVAEGIVLNPSASQAHRAELTTLLNRHQPALASRVKPSAMETPVVDVRVRS